MWILEVYVKNIASGILVSKEIFDGFSNRRDAEEKILEYYDVQSENKENIYTFFLISPWGTLFPVDVFGSAYLDMHLSKVPLII
jgi:hypothetical protein